MRAEPPLSFCRRRDRVCRGREHDEERVAFRAPFDAAPPTPYLAKDPALRVLFMSGYTDEYVSRGGSVRDVRIVEKPFDADKLLANMRALAPDWLAGCRLRPCWFEPTFHKHAGKLCHGVHIHVEDSAYGHADFHPWRLQALAFKALRRLQPDYPLWRDFPYEYERDRLAIDLLAGSARYRELVEAEQNPAIGLRVYVYSGGCSGFRYSLNLENEPAADDVVIESEGYIITKPDSTATDVEGVWAAGDVQDKIFRQAVTVLRAEGQGFEVQTPADRVRLVRYGAPDTFLEVELDASAPEPQVVERLDAGIHSHPPPHAVDQRQIPVAATTGIPQFIGAAVLSSLDFAARTIAGVDESPFRERLERAAIDVAAIALPSIAAARSKRVGREHVGTEAKPIEIVEDARLEFRPASDAIMIFNSKQHACSDLASCRPHGDCIDDVTEVEPSGGRRREARERAQRQFRFSSQCRHE